MEAKQAQSTSRPGEAGNDSLGKDEQEPQNLRKTMEGYEKEVLLDALAKHQGNKAKTAAMLGIDRKTLYTKLRKYGVM
jgi:two-component system response regulator HydG